MDTAHWPQEIQNPTNSCSKPSSNSSSLEKRARPQKDSAVNCPRCNSINTKFCYYNNYSLTQPRYFCKTCRRYWTEGGSLRNVPVGGGSRKNRRSSSSYNSSMPKKQLPDLVVPHASPLVLSQNPRMHDHEHEHGHDLNLGFPSKHDFKTIFHDLIQVPKITTTTAGASSAEYSALELLTGITTRGMMMNSFMPIPIPDPNSVYSSSSSGQLMIPMPEFKNPSMGDSYGNSIHDQSSSGRLLFPFEGLKTNTETRSNDHDGHYNVEQNRDQNGDTNGFWSGMLGGGSW